MNSRIAQNLLLLLTLGIPAVIFASLLYHRSAPVEVDLHREVNQLGVQLAAIDSRLNQNLLAQRLALASIARPQNEITNAYANLQHRYEEAFGKIPAKDLNIGKSLEDFFGEIESKLNAIGDAQIERKKYQAKSQALSASIEIAGAALQNAKASSNSALIIRAELQAQLRQLSIAHRSDQLNTASSAVAASTLKKTLEQAFDNAAISADTRAQLQLVMTSANAQATARQTMDKALAAVIEAPTKNALKAVQKSYDGYFDTRRERNENYRRALLGYFALLTIGAVYFGLRWRSRQRLQILQSDNQTLEQHVTSRTEELSQAYEELKESQGRLVQSEKMSALGQMIAGVAHEINTPLAYSRSNVELVKEQLGELNELVSAAATLADLYDDPNSHGEVLDVQFKKVATLGASLRQDGIGEEMDELLGASGSGLDQIAEMVMSLKNFSRVDKKKVERFNLNQGLDDSLLIAQNKLKHKVTVVKNYGDIPPVTCAPSQINQVFLNMLVNAAQAMEDQGQITITTVASGDHVDVIIEDTGSGIPEDVLPNIFDPFYTTKDVGEGTGLGLSICYKIIEQHGGTISVDSQQGVGTRFTISLFVAEDEFAASESLLNAQIAVAS